MKPRLVAVVGPTASGKSAAALALAEQLGGEIVNADSRQVYRGMDIGTAKPSPADFARVPHHLFDIVDPAERYSLALYREQLPAVLDDIWSRGRTPFLVGGTGQYIWAVLEDWRVPEVEPDPVLRDQLAAFADEHGHEALHARLAAVDPAAANQIHPRNVRRVVRALEVFEHTGKAISDQQTRGEPAFDFFVVGIARPMEELVYRINRRVEWMYEEGIVLETRALLEAGVPADASALSSIGYAEAVRFLRKEIKRDKAIELTKRATRRFARRQSQWFRREDPRIHWSAEDDIPAADIAEFLRRSGP